MNRRFGKSFERFIEELSYLLILLGIVFVFFVFGKIGYSIYHEYKTDHQITQIVNYAGCNGIETKKMVGNILVKYMFLHLVDNPDKYIPQYKRIFPEFISLLKKYHGENGYKIIYFKAVFTLKQQLLKGHFVCQAQIEIRDPVTGKSVSLGNVFYTTRLSDDKKYLYVKVNQSDFFDVLFYKK